MDERKRFMQRIFALPAMVSARQTPSRISGEHEPQLRTGGIEFEDTTEFIWGEDDIKDFADRASARAAKPLKRIRREEKENLFVCLTDMRPSLSYGATRIKRDFGIEIAGVLALTAIHSDDRAEVIGLRSCASFGELTGERDAGVVLSRLLALYDSPHMQADYDIAELICRAASVIPPASSVFVISDWIFSPAKDDLRKPLKLQSAYIRSHKALEFLAENREVSLIAVNDIRDRKVPDALLRLRSIVAGGVAVIDGASKKFRDTLDTLNREREEWLREIKRRSRIDHCIVETDTTFGYLRRLTGFLAARTVR